MEGWRWVMIAFKDFVPKQTRKQGFIKPPQWETVEQVVAAANEWIREQEVAVINVETIIAPDISRKGVQSGDGSLPGISGGGGGGLQFVRVWYRAD